MKIFINDIRIRARHGVMPQECTVGADFIVSLEAETDEERATTSDNLSDTISYADMAEAVRQEMGIQSQLLEHVAGRIGNRLMTTYPTLSSVKVRLIKCNPPISGLQCNGAGVEILVRRYKDD